MEERLHWSDVDCFGFVEFFVSFCQEANAGAGYLARSPRDRQIIDSIIAGAVRGDVAVHCQHVRCTFWHLCRGCSGDVRGLRLNTDVLKEHDYFLALGEQVFARSLVGKGFWQPFG